LVLVILDIFHLCVRDTIYVVSLCDRLQFINFITFLQRLHGCDLWQVFCFYLFSFELLPVDVCEEWVVDEVVCVVFAAQTGLRVPVQ